MKTGNTIGVCVRCISDEGASMEPGHEDREYPPRLPVTPAVTDASMEPGHEDREYAVGSVFFSDAVPCLNGARS